MKFTVLATLAVSSSNAAMQKTGTSSAAMGVLNVHWTDGMTCADWTDSTKLTEFVLEINVSDKTFEAYKQECAEAFYGMSQEEVPCLQAVYFPSGLDVPADSLVPGWAPVSGEPYYSCHGYQAEYLVTPTDSEWAEIAAAGLNQFDENNKVAGCINNSPGNIDGAYSCWRGPLMAGSAYLAMTATAALSLSAMI